MAFIDRLQPAPIGGGLLMEDYWVWCGSAIQGEDGRYHLYASRWPKSLPFFDGYRVRSEIVHAIADTPVGPYHFHDVVLGDRGARYWDGRMTHNPTIHRWGDTYLLFYIGATYQGPAPTGDQLRAGSTNQPQESYASIQIGLATSQSVYGPWTRPAQPILSPRPGHWDSTVVTNPAPCIRSDGSLRMLYRANTPHGLRLGLAGAPSWDAPLRRLTEEPVLVLEGGNHVEDPYLWWTDDHYEALAKDMNGGITDERHAGVHATSQDGIHWQLADPPKAYSRQVRWDDGTVTVQGSVERPQLLFQDGVPTHLFAATADGPGGFRAATRTWNMVFPLET